MKCPTTIKKLSGIEYKQRNILRSDALCEDVCVYILDKVNWVESRMMPTKMTLLQGSGNEREIRGAFPNSLRVLPTFLEDVLLLSLDPSKIPICNVFFPEPKMISILCLPYNWACLATFLPGLRCQSLRIPLNGGSAD